MSLVILSGIKGDYPGKMDKITFEIVILGCWFKFNLVELLCQGESDSLIET